MSTVIFESASIEHLKDETPQRPWRKKPTKFTVSVFLAVVVPGVIVAWLFRRCQERSSPWLSTYPCNCLQQDLQR
jgi:hypothetical protein